MRDQGRIDRRRKRTAHNHDRRFLPLESENRHESDRDQWRHEQPQTHRPADARQALARVRLRDLHAERQQRERDEAVGNIFQRHPDPAHLLHRNVEQTHEERRQNRPQ
jgi:hypothetical protein